MDTKDRSITLEVKGLFGTYNYSLNVNAGLPLILTGPNGYGKTTLLSIIKNIKDGNILYFLSFPFDEILFAINNKTILKIKSKNNKSSTDIVLEENENSENESVDLSEKTIEFDIDGDPNDNLELSNDIVEAVNRRMWNHQRHYIQEYSNREGNNKSDSMPLSYSRFVLDRLKQRDSKYSNIELAFARLPEVSYVQANRLYQSMIENDSDSVKFQRDNKILSEEIQNISNHLKSLLEDEYKKFLAHSQESDKSFINTILSQSDEIFEYEYKVRAKKIESEYEVLSRFSLAEKIKMPKYNQQRSYVLKGYVEELEKNLECYKIISRKLDTFTKLIDSKKLAGKKMMINREHGIRMVSTTDGTFIDIERLSSGEKNQIILFYDLLFRVPDDSVLLIDEPELSLHVAWQTDFLDDLLKIAKEKQLQVIVATHSPYIISGHWDLCYDLYEIAEHIADE